MCNKCNWEMLLKNGIFDHTKCPIKNSTHPS